VRLGAFPQMRASSGTLQFIGPVAIKKLRRELSQPIKLAEWVFGLGFGAGVLRLGRFVI